MKKLITFFLLLIILNLFVFSQVTFSKLDINNSNELLFSVSHDAVTEKKYNSLFVYNLDEEIHQSKNHYVKTNPQLLTCYPQSLEVLKENSVLQIRNRYGNAQYSVKDKTLKWVSIPQEIENNEKNFIPVLHNRLEPMVVSPDGNWSCYIKKKLPATGDLILKDNNSEKQYLLSSDVEFSFEKVPVLWSLDSMILVYEKNNSLYFLNLKDKVSLTQIPESFRQIGKGKINCLYWASKKNLIYINNEIVYTIPANELYTRALYSDLVGTGKIIGRLPYAFDDESDKFWTSDDGLSIVMVQNNRTLWYMELNGMDFNWVTTLFSYPFVNIPGTALSFTVFWVPQDMMEKQIPYVWIELLRSGKSESYVYRLQKTSDNLSAYFIPMPMSVYVSKPTLSPNKKLIAFNSEKSLHIYDIASWKQVAVLTDLDLVSYVWIDSKSMYIGEKQIINKWNFETNAIENIYLSSAEDYSWNDLKNSILVKNKYGVYEFNSIKNSWNKTNYLQVNEKQVQNSDWRVFISSSINADYKNSLYARKLTALSSNTPLFSTENSTTKYHRPRVALVFDCLDNSDGLTSVLNSLAKYNLKATFFLNGEFIRRFPNAVQEIANQDHQCASMFYTHFPLDSKTFKVDENFIRRGLARNEDDFFETTGKELALMWHTPYYFYNEVIDAATKKAGYIYIDKNINVEDSVTLDDVIFNNKDYKTTGQIINSVIPQLNDGSVIPINVGISAGSRNDYLYEKLDLLISGILSKGYDIVPVSVLSK